MKFPKLDQEIKLDSKEIDRTAKKLLKTSKKFIYTEHKKALKQKELKDQRFFWMTFASAFFCSTTLLLFLSLP